MEESPKKETPQLDMVIAFLIAIVSTTFAFASWRLSLASSSSGDASRQGIIDSIKIQTFTNENWRETYQEASFAENYAVYLSSIEALEASGNSTAIAQAADLRQYLLPNLQVLASPLASDPVYLNTDGTYNLQKRFDDLTATSTDLRDLNPQSSFDLAGQYNAEQRWLTVATVLLAISLFWLALAEIGGKRMRKPTLVIGVGVYAIALVSLVVIEMVSFFLRGGVL